jgi:hypothetical protein
MTHPITPPPELVQQWIQQSTTTECAAFQMAVCAAQWGADQELEACCEYVYERLKLTTVACIAQELRADRRPKPPSLKKQALEEFNHLMGELIGTERYKNRISIVRRALEQLDD